MIESNLRLVGRGSRLRGQGVPFLDLIQEGVVGLNRAVGETDWRRDLKLSTYATCWWIRQAVAAVDRQQASARAVRLPVRDSANRLRAIERSRRSLEASLGHEPTEQEEGAQAAELTVGRRGGDAEPGPEASSRCTSG